jgi:hypothetical protein
MARYRLKIVTDGSLDSPHTWAISRADEEFPVEKSRESFRTALLAKMAGSKILRQLETQQADAFKKAKR